MCTSQGSCASTRITLSASAVTVERSEFITRTSSPCKRPSWFSQSAGYFSRSDRVRASKSLDIRSLAAQEDKKDMDMHSNLGLEKEVPALHILWRFRAQIVSN